MTLQPAPCAPHYPSPSARGVDLGIHVGGLIFAAVGGAFLFALSAGQRSLDKSIAIAVYVVGLLAMLVCSAAYNFSSERRRALLRRLDHAGIFLMIAGTYTPFTVHALSGAWAVSMTSTVWGLAAGGALARLFLPGIAKLFWVVVYLALGWLGVVAVGPLAATLSRGAIFLLVAGGLVYSLGVAFYLMERLQYRRAIWHGHVIGAAIVHYFAVLKGVVLVH